VVSGKGAVFARALLAFLVLPGVVAFAVPVTLALASGRARLDFYVAATCFWSRQLLIYALIVAVLFHLRVIFGEEPWLARTHGADWDNYRSRVPRWIGAARAARRE
jgi:hypothetical protein